MTTQTEFKWEDIDSLEQLKLGDEVEYKSLGVNREYKYWGKVIDIRRNSLGVSVVYMEGDWNLVSSSLTGNKLVRKVPVFNWPDYIGACVEATGVDSVLHYVRVNESGPYEWVIAETGAYTATWELELTCAGTDLRVLGRGY